MSVCSFQRFTLLHIQTSSSSTYEPPVWLAVFLCICSHFLELTSSQRSFLFRKHLKAFYFQLTFFGAPVPQRLRFNFWFLALSKLIYLFTYLLNTRQLSISTCWLTYRVIRKGGTRRPHTSWLATMKNDLSCHILEKCERCHQADTGQATLEVIGSKWSYRLKWCKLNNDDQCTQHCQTRKEVVMPAKNCKLLNSFNSWLAVSCFSSWKAFI